MQFVRRVPSFLALSDEPEVVLAQYREMTRQVPWLYSLLIVNTSAVAFTHRGFAPPLLIFFMPAALCIVAFWRIVKWTLPRHVVTFRRARKELGKSIVFAGCYGLINVFWALCIAQYGGPYEQGHVALYISITVIACIFCLMHLPQAALLGCLLVTGPYVAYYFLQRTMVWMAIALNIALVSFVMIRVLLNSFRGFVDLVRSQRDMAIKSAEAERLSEENARLAMTDSLTGLPNRRFFFAQLEAAIETARRQQTRFAVGVFDLDRFKAANDTYGHVFGDRLLEEVGERFAAAIGSDVVLARLGGDEFGVIFLGDCEEAEALGNTLCETIGKPFQIDEVRLSLGCSAGFAIFPDAGETAHMLFDRSDYALYHSKLHQRGSCSLFSVEHEVKIRSDRAIEVALQAADLAAELSFHLQPIVDLTTMQVTTAEALARWNSPVLGSVSPDKFITAAERSGMVMRVTHTLFTKALETLADLPATLRLSFNLSAHDIVCQETIEFLIDGIGQSGLAPGRLIFELTETALMRDFDGAVAAIQELRSTGCQVVLDDFGTGYSSLSYLRRLPIDKVKVDRSFVTNSGGSGENLLAAIRGLCHNLGLRCVVEGIETPAQLKLVRELGYEEAQGYLLGRPKPIDELPTEIDLNKLETGSDQLTA